MKKFHVLYQNRFGGAVGLVTVEAASHEDAVAKADAVLTVDNTPIGVVTAYEDGCPMLFANVQIRQTYRAYGYCTLPLAPNNDA